MQIVVLLIKQPDRSSNHTITYNILIYLYFQKLMMDFAILYVPSIKKKDKLHTRFHYWWVIKLIGTYITLNNNQNITNLILVGLFLADK